MLINEQALETIEQELEITIPAAYRELFASRGEELLEIESLTDDLSQLWIDADHVISNNQGGREESGLDEAFPNWWQTFFMIGTNGGGDFFTLRIDDQPGVWMIGTDCGDEPTLINESFSEFVDDLLASRKAEQQSAAETAERRLVFQEEEAAEREEIARSSKAKNAQEWLDCTSGYRLFRLLDRLYHKPSARKLRLYGIACCRQISDLESDDDCANAIALAEAMTLGEATKDEIDEMRDLLKEKLAELEAARESLDSDTYHHAHWGVQAVKHLFQDERAYLKDAPIYPGDSRLPEVYNAVSYVLNGMPYGTDIERDLLREVLGNPFLPVEFDPEWRSDEVVSLAQQMFDSQQFDQMSQLAQALQAAGCDNERIIAHCQRATRHVRGCWVLDLILENEPEPESSQEFNWDFHCQHKRIDGAALKEQIAAFGTIGKYDRNDDAALLKFADWLQEQGDPDWAEYIRVRCALDGQTPGEDYFDLVEQLFECAVGMPRKVFQFENIYFSGIYFSQEKWWEDEIDGFERGLPTLVHAVKPSDDAGPVEVLTQRIQAIVERTPIRGVDFEEYYAEEMADILASPGGKELRFLAFENEDSEEETSPVLQALASAPGTRTIERLSIQNGLNYHDDTLALAAAPLESLRRLDMKFGYIACPHENAETLLKANWFQQLGQLFCGIGRDCAEVVVPLLAQLPGLHSLALYRPGEQVLSPLTTASEFKALRRLCLLEADLSAEAIQALCAMQAPQLIELWLEECKASSKELSAIFASPLLDNLRAISIDVPKLDAKSLANLAKSRFARQLRMLRLFCGDHNLIGKFKSLGTTALAESDAFENVTTLTIDSPYVKKAEHDTGVLLRQLNMPRLRHLTLKNCWLDDNCALALAESPSFANLKRLSLDQSFGAPSLSPAAIETMLRSKNLENLLELQMDDFPMSESVLLLADPKLLPKLKKGAIRGCEAEDDECEAIQEQRPILRVNS